MNVLVLATAVLLMASPGRSDVIDQFPNACPEGQYLDLQSTCAPLLRPGLGFKRTVFLAEFQPFASNVQTLSQCGERQLQDALDAVEQAGGGIVVIPACTIQVTRKLQIPSNTIIRGSGPGTRLVAAPGYSTGVLEVQRHKNVVIQDLSLVGSLNTDTGVVIWRSQNVLVERVSIDSFGKNNLFWRNSHGVTVRYTRANNAKTWHGINNNDCNPDDPAIPDLQECQATAGELGPYGVLFSDDYAVYSNHAQGNGTYGIDIHASDGEIAGNTSIGNAYTAKFPDAQDVVIHHNRFEGGNGIMFRTSYHVPGRAVRRVVLYQNDFRVDVPTHTLRIWEEVESVWAIDNNYLPGDNRWIANLSENLFACPGTDETDGTVRYGYNSFETADPAFCSGTGFLSLFGGLTAPQPPILMNR